MSTTRREGPAQSGTDQQATFLSSSRQRPSVCGPIIHYGLVVSNAANAARRSERAADGHRPNKSDTAVSPTSPIRIWVAPNWSRSKNPLPRCHSELEIIAPSGSKLLTLWPACVSQAKVKQQESRDLSAASAVPLDDPDAEYLTDRDVGYGATGGALVDRLSSLMPSASSLSRRPWSLTSNPMWSSTRPRWAPASSRRWRTEAALRRFTIWRQLNN